MALPYHSAEGSLLPERPRQLETYRHSPDAFCSVQSSLADPTVHLTFGKLSDVRDVRIHVFPMPDGGHSTLRDPVGEISMSVQSEYGADHMSRRETHLLSGEHLQT